jgi:hypothetical protein
MKKCVTMVFASIVLGCGPEKEHVTDLPLHEEVRAMMRAYCEQPIMPCRYEETGDGPPTEQDYEECTDAHEWWYFDRVEFSPECSQLILDYVTCATGMTCDEQKAHQSGRSDQCNDEKWAATEPGCLW